MRIRDVASIFKYQYSPPSSTSILKVCFVGAGKMARQHIETIKGMPGIKVVGITSQSGKSGEALAKEFNINKAYTDIDLMLSEQQPDALMVAVNHSVAFDIYKKLLSYGIPILLEKPAGYSTKECRELIDIARENNTMNMVAVNRRFYGTVQQALLATNHLSKIRGILVEANEPIQNYRTRLQYDSWLYDSWLIANSIHAIDLFRMFCGEVKEVLYSSINKNPIEPFGDDFDALIQFESGITGNFVAHYNSPGGFGVKLYGDGVCADIKPLEKGFLQYLNGRRIALEMSDEDQSYKPGLFAQNAYFFHCVSEKIKPNFPASDLEDHYKSIELAENILNFNKKLK